MNSSSDTPRVDANLAASAAYNAEFMRQASLYGGVTFTIPDPNAPQSLADLARQLERELAEFKDCATMDELRGTRVRLYRGLAEMRELLRKASDDWLPTHPHWKEVRAVLGVSGKALAPGWRVCEFCRAETNAKH